MKQSIIFSVLLGMLLLVSCAKDTELNLLNPIEDYAISEVDLRNHHCPDQNPNIAFDKEVSLHGTFFTDGWGGGMVVDKQTIVDGEFFPRGHQWDQGPVWWDSRDREERWVEIDLGGLYRITSLIVQADDNDAYKLLYWMNPATGSWESLWDVPNYDVIPDPSNWGMQTRPNPANDSERYCLPDPVMTTHLRFEGVMDVETDFFFSVSEIQAFGVCIIPVDIKPGSCPNPLNTKSKGVLPVAILGMPSVDVTTIDPATVRLHGVEPIRWAVEDVGTPYRPFVGKEDAYACHEYDGDRFPDLTLKFNKEEIVEAIGDVERGDVLILPLTGAFQDGILFEGEDVMVVVK